MNSRDLEHGNSSCSGPVAHSNSWCGPVSSPWQVLLSSHGPPRPHSASPAGWPDLASFLSYISMHSSHSQTACPKTRGDPSTK